MPRMLYIRPVGLFEAGGASDGAQAGRPVAGGPLAFSTVEVIERRDGCVTRRIAGAGEASGCADLLAAIGAPRPPIAGLSLDRPRIMGIVNVTPDSFSDGGSFATGEAAIAHGLRLVEEGADILDIGGESTRPGSEPVALEEELRRVMPVLEGLRARTRTPISIDTRKAAVMRRAAAAGADILNDVSALSHDPDALGAACESGLPVVLMHAQGEPKTMNDNPQYEDVVLDVFDYLEQRIAACEAAGIPKSRLVADPGIGFGKHLHHNVAVLSAMSLYHGLGVPVLLGASRKKLIGQLCNVEAPKERVPGSIAAALSAVAQGVQIVRAHDVAATRQALAVWQAVSRGTEALRA
jgi:dihydropteroate synthase